MVHISPMEQFHAGDLVEVPCDIQAGPFPDEKLVTVETEDGRVISGFVKTDYLNEDRNTVLAKILAVSGDDIQLRLLGSFFTTALGFASVSHGRITKAA